MTTEQPMSSKILAQELEQYNKSKKVIEAAIQANHDHTHNLVSCELRRVSCSAGVYYANKLIDELKLTTLFGIKKVQTNG